MRQEICYTVSFLFRSLLCSTSHACLAGYWYCLFITSNRRWKKRVILTVCEGMIRSGCLVRIVEKEAFRGSCWDCIFLYPKQAAVSYYEQFAFLKGVLVLNIMESIFHATVTRNCRGIGSCVVICVLVYFFSLLRDLLWCAAWEQWKERRRQSQKALAF